MTPNIIVQTFYISTGRKNAMHTLRSRRDCAGLNPNIMPDYYIKNLAVDVEDAQKKALDYFQAWKDRFAERDDFRLSLELEPEYDITIRRGKLSAYDTTAIEEIERGILPFGKHKGKTIVEMTDGYLLYFADMLSQGGELRPVMEALANTCMGVALERGAIAKREVARQERRDADAKSDFVGTIGERREFEGEIVTQFFKPSYPEAQQIEYRDIGYWITKVRVAGNLVVYVGKQLGERGQTIRFKATIKKHDEYKGVKTTKINRPKIIEPKQELAA